MSRLGPYLLIAAIALGACTPLPHHEHEPLVRRVERMEKEQQQMREGLLQVKTELEKVDARTKKTPWWRTIFRVVVTLISKAR